MATRLPSAIPRRPTTTTSAIIPTHISPASAKPSLTPLSHTPSRAATLIRRPRRPYTFTQLVQQTDGSTYTVRTTSPLALYKSTKDTRNHVLWQPSDRTLRNVEVDEAGKLAAFRERFGRGWDAEAPPGPGATAAARGEKEGQTEGVEGAAGSAPAAAAAKDEADGSAPAAPAAPRREDALSGLISSYSAESEAMSKPGKKK